MCVVRFEIYRVDGIIALLIVVYMIVQSIMSFPQFIGILMNAVPPHINIEEVKKEILQFKNVRSTHHIHLRCIGEYEPALECHIENDDIGMTSKISEMLKTKFDINYCNIQIEQRSCNEYCNLRRCGSFFYVVASKGGN